MKDLFYCHGLPGSAAEISRISPQAAQSLQIIPPLDFAAFDTATAQKSTGVHVIGFSLGAMTALKIAAKRSDIVTQVSLIAPAAPLDLGDFLPQMAGRAVFNVASKGRLPFSAFTALQRIGVGVAAKTIINAMFADSPEADKALLMDSSFTASLRAGLKSSLGTERQAYLRAVQTYVQPWAEDLKRVSCPIALHHGTSDDWAPFEMSNALAENCPTKTTIIPYEGLGHYSTLEAALPSIISTSSLL